VNCHRGLPSDISFEKLRLESTFCDGKTSGMSSACLPCWDEGICVCADGLMVDDFQSDSLMLSSYGNLMTFTRSYFINNSL
jgi:hypothetical protein